MSLEKTLKNYPYIVGDQELESVVSHDRFTKILIRCGRGRLICPAQDAKHFIETIAAAKIDYVRDVQVHQGN